MTTPEALAAQLKKSEIVDHEQTLKSCDAILKKSKNDVQTKHIKAIALLKLDRYSEALEVFEKESQLQQKAALVYAYSLYRGGRPKRAAEVAAGQTDRGARHVEAQAVGDFFLFSFLTWEALSRRRLFWGGSHLQRPLTVVVRAERFADQSTSGGGAVTVGGHS